MAGHQDGGKLILDTYTEEFGERDASYEKINWPKSNQSHVYNWRHAVGRSSLHLLEPTNMLRHDECAA